MLGGLHSSLISVLAHVNTCPSRLLVVPLAGKHVCPSGGFFGRKLKIEHTVQLHHGFSWSSVVTTAALDQDLRVVLELASDGELSELSSILYGKSLLSPLLKSVTHGGGFRNANLGKRLGQSGLEGRDAFLERLESRFLFLAADAKDVIRGRRPTYRNVLLQVCKKLNVPCSVKLSTEDLEAEIFLHLLQGYTIHKHNPDSSRKTGHPMENIQFSGTRASKWGGYVAAALKLSSKELLSVLLKGGSALTMSTLQKAVAKRLGGRVLAETARYQVTKEVLKKGGHVVAQRLECHLALLAARQGLVGAASQYMAARIIMMVLGPVFWGTFLADLVITSVGTDYARVVRAIYAFAQIRLTRTYGWTYAGQALD